MGLVELGMLQKGQVFAIGLMELRVCWELFFDMDTIEDNADSGFVRFLDNQIEYMFRISSVSGWTIWTLVGALATLVWVTGRIVAHDSFDWHFTSLLFLYLSYLLGVFPIKESSSRVDSGPLRYAVFRDLVYGRQRALLFELTKNFFLLVLCCLAFGGGFEAFSYIVLFFWLTRLILTLIGIVFSFLSFPMVWSGKTQNGKNYEKIYDGLSFLFAVCLLFGFYGFSKSISNSALFEVEAFKVPVLLVVVVSIIKKIIDTDVAINSGVIKLLAEIRSKLVLKEMAYAEAFSEVRVALLGYDAGEIFKKEFQTLLISFREISSVNHKASKLLLAIEQYLNTPVELVTEKQKKVVLLNLDQIYEYLIGNKKNFGVFRKKLATLEVKIQFLKKTGCEPGVYSDQATDLEEIMDEIDSSRTKFAKRFVSVKKLAKAKLEKER